MLKLQSESKAILDIQSSVPQDSHNVFVTGRRETHTGIQPAKPIGRTAWRVRSFLREKRRRSGHERRITVWTFLSYICSYCRGSLSHFDPVLKVYKVAVFLPACPSSCSRHVGARSVSSDLGVGLSVTGDSCAKLTYGRVSLAHLKLVEKGHLK